VVFIIELLFFNLIKRIKIKKEFHFMQNRKETFNSPPPPIAASAKVSSNQLNYFQTPNKKQPFGQPVEIIAGTFNLNFYIKYRQTLLGIRSEASTKLCIIVFLLHR